MYTQIEDAENAPVSANASKVYSELDDCVITLDPDLMDDLYRNKRIIEKKGKYILLKTEPNSMFKVKDVQFIPPFRIDLDTGKIEALR